MGIRRRLLVVILAPLGFVFGVMLPIRAWWRIRQRGTPRRERLDAMAAELRAMAEKGYDQMTPEMRAKFDADAADDALR
jgi:hypothetical protein